jgi:hypothetical protein
MAIIPYRIGVPQKLTVNGTIDHYFMEDKIINNKRNLTDSTILDRVIVMVVMHRAKCLAVHGCGGSTMVWYGMV